MMCAVLLLAADEGAVADCRDQGYLISRRKH
jgi:hypothetical protein